MADSTMKLVYFNAPGKADLIRLVLAVAGKEFEDVRLNRALEWATVKPTRPFEQVPTLEIDGRIHGQTLAIANFLAKECGLYGKTNMDALIIDQVGQLWNQYITHERIRVYKEPEATLPELKRRLKEEIAPRYLGYMENLLKESGTGYFVGNSMTLADIVLFDFCTGGFLKWFTEDHLDKFPLVKANVEKVGNNEKIKACLPKQPKQP